MISSISHFFPRRKLLSSLLLAGVLLAGCSSTKADSKTASASTSGEALQIGVPSDATNQSRALSLLDKAGLIKVDPAAGYTPELKDVQETIYNVKIVPAAANTLVASLDDLAAATINGTYAVPAGLNPEEDGLITEVQEPGSDNPFINVIVARTADKDDPTYQKIVKAYQSQQVAKYILAKNEGAAVPAFEYDKNNLAADPTAYVQEVESYKTTADGSKKVKIGVCGSGEVFKAVQKELDEQGENILLDIVVFDAYNLPNEALNAGDIDLNAFQHKAYLNSEIKSQGYDIVAIGDTSSAPLTLYSKAYKDLDSLKEAAGKAQS